MKYLEPLVLSVLILLLTSFASSASISSTSDWFSGSFNGTTVDKPDNKNLSIGYSNGTSEDSLNAFWRFDGGLDDFSENNFDSVSSQNLIFSEGLFGTKAVRFRASDNPFVEYPDTSDPDREKFAVSGWIKTSTSENDKPIVEKSIGDREGYVFLVDNYYGTDRLSLYIQSSQDGKQRFRTDQTLDKNRWYHVAATYNGTNVSLYVDGEEKSLADGQSSATYNVTDQNVLIGASSTSLGGDYFNGSIDELRFFNQSLNASQIKSEYFFGKLFKGEYNSEIFSYDQPQKWEFVKTSSGVPENTTLEAVFQVSDDGFATIKDSQVVSLEGGKETHKLNLQDAAGSRIVFNGSSSDVTKTWTVQSVEADYFRDFKVNTLDLNRDEFVEDQAVEATVNISNEEPDSADVKVQLEVQTYNGTMWKTYSAENKTFNSEGDDSVELNYGFNTIVGPHRVVAKADPANQFSETNETNNEQITQFEVPFYHVYYGNAQSTVTLSDFQDQTFYSFTEDDVSGTVYYLDSDASFSFTDLKPLQDYQDLEELDTALGSTGFNDSIQNQWGDGSQIKRTSCFTISGAENCNVPVSNSTENSFFETGILYDGGQTYQNGDSVAFISDVVPSEQGQYGTYDYEAKIPSTLPETEGSSKKVDVYMEIE